MKDKDYKRAWLDFKETSMQDYIRTYKAYGKKHIAVIIKTVDLARMDEMDGTNEFKNLLYDLERGEA
ncbi:hypothetical protein [Staphylococcus haemolyticus]|uniref:hypothetical protein n=1 Tax=Staphylococcus haemolyticus TaxID=1283 RepID=UPI00265BD971|nr:hypothetical protein [Staphylococcus haemolyticus]MDO0970576.1 hypothetical protein [Staphylococcus haemolyticus]